MCCVMNDVCSGVTIFIQLKTPGTVKDKFVKHENIWGNNYLHLSRSLTSEQCHTHGECINIV